MHLMETFLHGLDLYLFWLSCMFAKHLIKDIVKFSFFKCVKNYNLKYETKVPIILNCQYLT
jgi:hypothetical protein